MQGALPAVVIAVVVLAGVVAVAILLTAHGIFDRIGEGDLSLDHDARGSTDDPLRDEDVRQLLVAANARRAARGRPPVDVGSVSAGPSDELRAEIRAFVESRNAGRLARGQPPLDVDAEVERRLSAQDG